MGRHRTLDAQVVQGGCVFAIRSILFAGDFSECSLQAFGMAAALARDHGARLVILHIATPPPLVSYRELERSLEPVKGYRRELEDRLRELYPEDSGVDVTYRIGDGDPATEIIGIARELSCDLIVMGTKGNTGLERLLMGSVAERVMRGAACPVITVRAGTSTK